MIRCSEKWKSRKSMKWEKERLHSLFASQVQCTHSAMSPRVEDSWACLTLKRWLVSYPSLGLSRVLCSGYGAYETDDFPWCLSQCPLWSLEVGCDAAKQVGPKQQRTKNVTCSTRERAFGSFVSSNGEFASFWVTLLISKYENLDLVFLLIPYVNLLVFLIPKVITKHFLNIYEGLTLCVQC